MVTYNPPKIGAEEMAKLYPDPSKMRIIDCAAGTGLVGLEVSKLFKVQYSSYIAV